MVIFNEHFPSQKLAILTFIQQQKALSEVANALKTDNSEKKLPLQSVFDIPRKESWMEKLQTEADDYVKKSGEINEKINELHDSIEAIDDKDFNDKLTQKCLLKNSESSLAIKRMEGGDVMTEICRNDAMNVKKATKNLSGIRHKSKFTKVIKKASSNNVVEKKAASSFSLSRKSSIMSVEVSPSIRKILDDAKKKHTSKKFMNEIPINVVTLELK